MQQYRGGFRRDVAFYIFILGYGALTFALSRAVGRPATFQPLSVVSDYVSFATLGLLVVGIWLALRSLSQPSPVAALSAEMRALTRPERVASASLILGLAVFMSIFGSAKALLPHLVPFWADPMLAQLDAALAGNRAPWTYLPRSPAVTLVVDRFYGVGWFTVMVASIAAAVMSRDAYRQQYVWTFLLAWTLLGNVVACAAMSGGPVYFEALTGGPEFRAVAADVAAHGPWSQLVRNQLWNGYIDGVAGLAQGISAFPSMHLSISTLVVLQANRIHPLLARIAVALLIWILASSVYLGWHYAVDGYFSIAATILIWKAVGHMLRTSGEEPVLHPAIA